MRKDPSVEWSAAVGWGWYCFGCLCPRGKAPILFPVLSWSSGKQNAAAIGQSSSYAAVQINWMTDPRVPLQQIGLHLGLNGQYCLNVLVYISVFCFFTILWFRKAACWYCNPFWNSFDWRVGKESRGWVDSWAREQIKVGWPFGCFKPKIFLKGFKSKSKKFWI